MPGEKTVDVEVTYLRRLGALTALLCGAAALLGAVLVALEPAPGNVAALVVSACLAVAGAAVFRRA